MTEWRSIGTAPMGEEVLVWARIVGVFPEQESMFSAGFHELNWWSTFGSIPLEPTHWMPLPPPPRGATMTTQELARVIYDAFKEQEFTNFVEFGDSFRETHLDGDFDLYKVAEAVLAKVEEVYGT